MSTSPAVAQAGAERHFLGLVLLVEAVSDVCLDVRLRELGYVVIGPIDTADLVAKVLRSVIPDGAILDTNAGKKAVTVAAYRLKGLGVPFLVVSGGEPFDLTDPVLAAAPVLPTNLVNRHVGEFMRNLLRAGHSRRRDGVESQPRILKE